MPDEDFSDDLDDDGGNIHAQLRIERKRAAELEAQVTQAAEDRKELAFLKAGLPQSKTTDFFMKHYDGELNPDAIAAAAEEAGIVSPATQQANESIQAQAGMAQGMSGGEFAPVGRTTVGPPDRQTEVPAEEAEMWEAFVKAAQEGKGDFGQAANILRSYGRETGTEGTEMLNSSPVTNPLR
jgi:hypothetical protein